MSVGDPTYTRSRLELFCRNRLFRYSKARSSSKNLRKPTCRARGKKHQADDLGDDQADDEDYLDEPEDNITTDSNMESVADENEYDDFDPEGDDEMKYAASMNSDMD